MDGNFNGFGNGWVVVAMIVKFFKLRIALIVYYKFSPLGIGLNSSLTEFKFK